ncbi:hypothetical protein BO71DRAFT_425894 [Aspergillus ellipticus CBS 707.79]|uniref:Uncharacterized protein n=1 Tax=Aspergillus ellipticus CBS 707.79 TaxID=1448320 RepID=A0A319DM43_9EURO|nr:hypothetical protein BO71DRAFT_425894 [Aspergillus ellipticus CBS 707.79]
MSSGVQRPSGGLGCQQNIQACPSGFGPVFVIPHELARWETTNKTVAFIGAEREPLNIHLPDGSWVADSIYYFRRRILFAEDESEIYISVFEYTSVDTARLRHATGATKGTYDGLKQARVATELKDGKRVIEVTYGPSVFREDNTKSFVNYSDSGAFVFK